jgi:hypothetical protein
VKNFEESTDQSKIENIIRMICKDPIHLRLEDMTNDFDTLLDGFKKDFISLKGVQINRIETNADQCKILIKTSTNHTFYFMGLSENEALLKVFEFLINSEKTVIALSACIKDAALRHRIELSAQYLNYLTEMVKVSNYENVIKKCSIFNA